MFLKNCIKYSYPVVFLRIFYAKIVEVLPATRHLATAGLRSHAEKLQTDLAIRTHALEKGMSIGRMRIGFGQQKAVEIIRDLKLYMKLGGSKRFTEECCSIIKSYIKFNEEAGANMNKVKTFFEPFCEENEITLYDMGGIFHLSHTKIHEQQHATFDVFSQSRYSVRDFGTTPINREDIEKSLQLCERTPSACNRQSQRVHVYLNKDLKDKICHLQLGCNGFIDEMQGAILVCSDLGCYNFQELNQAYVDGGLYAMNLLYALHYYNIASIPLTMAHKASYLQTILKEMNINNNETPVLLIAIGSYKDEWKVAQAHRYPWQNYTSFYK